VIGTTTIRGRMDSATAQREKGTLGAEVAIICNSPSVSLGKVVYTILNNEPLCQGFNNRIPSNVF
jgi:hypothetical protein